MADWVGLKTVPEATPLALKPVPETLTVEMVTFEFPVFVNDTACVLLLPTVTLPKLRLAGIAERADCTTPVPDRETVSVESDALLWTVKVPVVSPAFCGLN